MIEMTCSTCRFSPVICDKKVLFPKCLIDCKHDYVHKKYPEYKRIWYYEYRHWEPRVEVCNVLLTDGDFEL
jgi:hypothetical protein